MFYVYSGYVNSDHYDSSERVTHTLDEYATREEVEAAYNEFMKERKKDDINVHFTVIEGKERIFIQKTIVTSWVLE